MKTKRKPNLFLTAALALLCLVLITTYFSSGILARYTTKSSGSDSARIAAFMVDAEMAPGTEENSYLIHIRNDGETAVSCTVQITLPDPQLGLIREVTVNSETKPFDANGTAVFEKLCQLQPGESVNTVALRLIPKENGGGETVNQPDFSNSAVAEERVEAPFELRVICTQLD